MDELPDFSIDPEIAEVLISDQIRGVQRARLQNRLEMLTATTTALNLDADQLEHLDFEYRQREEKLHDLVVALRGELARYGDA